MNTRNKVLLTAAVVGVIGVLIAVGTSALFSASTVSNENTAGTGSLSATNNGLFFNSSAVGSTKMKPIDTILNARTQNVVVGGTGTVTNNGQLTASFRVGQPSGATAVTGDTPTPLVSPTSGLNRPGLHETLRLCISSIETNPANRDCGVYSGPFVMGATTGNVGVVTPGNSHSLYFEVWMLEDPAVPTDNGYQNKDARAYFEFTGN